eukprot:TRINITY_DN1232_c0_g2_i4.p1 TRINITY_DN1232_c0_g2~~TRINITY_DN1232_c0_g2_i4.p1  ORF type:complete len:154 (-),score=14.99 TRINITY_DN1232_c0_g2_i4:761-1222(-)
MVQRTRREKLVHAVGVQPAGQTGRSDNESKKVVPIMEDMDTLLGGSTESKRGEGPILGESPSGARIPKSSDTVQIALTESSLLNTALHVAKVGPQHLVDAQLRVVDQLSRYALGRSCIPFPSQHVLIISRAVSRTAPLDGHCTENGTDTRHQS